MCRNTAQSSLERSAKVEKHNRPLSSPSNVRSKRAQSHLPRRQHNRCLQPRRQWCANSRRDSSSTPRTLGKAPAKKEVLPLRIGTRKRLHRSLRRAKDKIGPTTSGIVDRVPQQELLYVTRLLKSRHSTKQQVKSQSQEKLQTSKPGTVNPCRPPGSMFVDQRRLVDKATRAPATCRACRSLTLRGDAQLL